MGCLDSEQILIISTVSLYICDIRMRLQETTIPTFSDVALGLIPRKVMNKSSSNLIKHEDINTSEFTSHY